MRTFGGRGAATAAALTLALPVTLLSGCSGAGEQARTAQTHLSRIDEVQRVDVSTPTIDRDAAITVVYEDIDDTAGLSALIGEIDRVADEQGYRAYRLELASDSDDGAHLVVDETFAGRSDEEAVLDSWYVVTGAVLGGVEYDVQSGALAVVVDSGGGIAHDIEEVARTGYGDAATTWTFRNGDTSFVASGAITGDDLPLFQGVQRSIGSESLPATATGWQLDRRDDHVRLDLEVGLRDGAVDPTRLTASAYGEVLAPLAAAALTATRAAGLPVWLGLGYGPAEHDELAVWSSTQRPVRGRDPLGRGWDVWLSELARRTA